MFYKKKTSAPSSSDSPFISHSGLRPLRLVEKLVAADIIQPFSVPKTPPTLDIKKQPRSTANAPKSLSASSRHSIGPIKPRASSAGQTTVVSKRAPFVVPRNYSAPRVPRATPTTVTRPAPSSGEGLAARRRAANNVSRQVPKVSRPRAKLPVSLLATPAKPAPATVLATKCIRKSLVAERSTIKSTFQSRIPVFVGRGSFSKVFTPSSTPRIYTSRIPRLRYTGGSPATSKSSRSNCSVSSIISSNPHTPCPSPILVVEARSLAPRVVSVVEAAVTTSVPAIGAPQDRSMPVDVAKITEDATLAMEVALKNTVSNRLIAVKSIEAGSPEISDIAATESTQPPPSRMTLSRSHGAQSTIFSALFAELKAGHPELRDVTATESSRLPLGDSKPLSHPDRSHGPQRTLFSALFSEAGHPALRDGTATKSTRPLPSRLSDPKPDRSDGSQSNILGALFAELKFKLSGTTGAKRPTSGMRPFILSATGGNRRDKENVQVESELQQAFARRRSSAFGLPLKSESQASDKSEVRVQERRPLVSVRLAANYSRSSLPTGTPPPPPTSPARSPSSPPTDAADSMATPPGAVYVTELINTAYGTRKVRRSIIPPMEEGARPSRDPRIVMELDRLRAQQKVGGGAGAGAVVEEVVR